MAIVDTNASPEMIDYPIAGNDDAIRAIRVILQKLVDAIVSASGDSSVTAQAEWPAYPLNTDEKSTALSISHCNDVTFIPFNEC